MRIRRAFSLTLIILAVALATPARAADEVRISNAQVIAGEEFALTVEMETESALGGWQILLRWSSGAILLDSVSINKDAFDPGYLYPAQAIDQQNRVVNLLAAPNPSNRPPPISPGVYTAATLYFRVSASASDQVAFVDSAIVPVGSSTIRTNFGTYAGFAVFPDVIPGVVIVGSPESVAISLSPSQMTFRANPNRPSPAGQMFDLLSAGSVEFPWTATWSSTWLSVSPPFGKTPAFPTASVDAFALTYGEYRDTIWVSSPYATNSPVPLTVRLVVDTASAPPPENGFALYQCRPSPFVTYHDPQTEIPFNLVDADHVTIAIYDALGRRVRTLVSQSYSEGDHAIVWDGRDRRGVVVASGRYFYRMVTSRGTQARPLIVIK